MKKSMMSVTMLVVSISMVVMFLFGSVANAQNGRTFIYDKKANQETVYTLDETGKYLSPKLKYEFQKNEAGATVEKKAFRWNETIGEWQPYYLMTFAGEGFNSVIEYALWNEVAGDFSLNMQKVVYNNDMVTYLSYRWNPAASDWDLQEQFLFQNYLAANAAGME